jgi:hypothetical protein
MATKKKNPPKKKPPAQQSLAFHSRAMVLHRSAKKKRTAAKKAAPFKPRKASTMATHKKKKRPKAVYRTVKKGGHKRRTVALKGPVFKGSKRGKRRRVARVNPRRRTHHRRTRHNPGGVLGAVLAVGAGFLTGVLVRVGTHMAAPGSASAAKIAGGIGAAVGLGMAAKMSNPLYGIGVAVGALDAAFQNDTVFKAEMLTAPKATTAALGAITYNNLRGIEMARSVPGYARMGNLPGYAKLNPMGAIVANNMAGFAGGDQIGAMRVRNPFE